ncbi:glycosyltransferase family 4 protein [Proteinivorax hydrogeniformans]|uniref:Glycosyltransferase family 4 protein n=1 Tax=Proteinivorax hydrogeniformans TaxID=1826727 RepID=A0AAU8HTJ9_9FIRM
MKILIVKSVAAGGIEKHVKDLCRALEKDGHKCQVIKVKFSLRSGLKSLYNYIKAIDDFRPGIVHFHGFKASLYALYPSKQIRKIITVHNDLEHLPKRRKNLLARAFRISAKQADYIICVSKHLKEYIKPLLQPNKKVSVIYNGIKLPPLMKNMPDKNINIGCCGRLTEIKGFHLLIDAFKKIATTDVKIHLHIIGDGPQRKNLEKLAKGVNERVIFHGFKSNPYVKMSRFDIFVQPSITEGFGITVLEAMALNVPVIVSNAGGLTEIVKNNKNGLIVPKGSSIELERALKKLILNVDLRKKLSKNRGYVEKNFSIESMYQQTVKVFKESLADNEMPLKRA